MHQFPARKKIIVSSWSWGMRKKARCHKHFGVALQARAGTGDRQLSFSLETRLQFFLPRLDIFRPTPQRVRDLKRPFPYPCSVYRIPSTPWFSGSTLNTLFIVGIVIILTNSRWGPTSTPKQRVKHFVCVRREVLAVLQVRREDPWGSERSGQVSPV